ncbi:MAG: elongation factor P [Pseudomonadota bacterium]
MKTPHILILTLVAATIAASVPSGAQEGRPLRTLPQGTYACALPGDANGDATTPMESEGFRIVPGSGYRDAEGVRGLYLLRGTEVIFTSGPKKGQRFERLGNNTLRRLNADGSKSRLSCIRLGGTS